MSDNLFNRVRIVMVSTSEAGNIGAAARAMKNMALTNLYLVKPKIHPSAKATARASGADDVLANAIICQDLTHALYGCNLVIGASARQRNIKWQQLDVIDSTKLIHKTLQNEQQEIAIVFGTENAGLTNDELDLCQVLLTIPGNPDYFSLNIAAAIQVVSYQLFVELSQKEKTSASEIVNLANFNEVENFYQHLQDTLMKINYVDKNKPIEKLMRRLRKLFHRTNLEKDEVAILRGILTQIDKN